MRLAGLQARNGRHFPGLDVGVPVIAALRAGVLRWIPLYGDDQFRLRIDAPHGIYQIARVLGTQLQAELAAR